MCVDLYVDGFGNTCQVMVQLLQGLFIRKQIGHSIQEQSADLKVSIGMRAMSALPCHTSTKCQMMYMPYTTALMIQTARLTAGRSGRQGRTGFAHSPSGTST